MRYEEPVYRPPSESDSLIIQATIGCPHNKCSFCGMYKGKRFRIRKVADIKEDLLAARDTYGPDTIHSIFFADGNTIIMRTSQLAEILAYSYEIFPKLQRITLYASAKFIKFKTLAELETLRKAGLKRVHKGLESGSDKVLKLINKGADSKTMITTGRLVKDAGLELSEYVLVGIGGQELSEEHARETARVLSAINPDFIRLRTWVPVESAPLYKDYAAGKFKLLTPHQALRETRLLLENLKGGGLLLSDHVSNFVNISGYINRDRQKMLDKIDRALKMDESEFRPSVIDVL
ncbi:MAG: radical SAM protein [Candidatus Brocadiia bacterium]